MRVSQYNALKAGADSVGTERLVEAAVECGVELVSSLLEAMLAH